MPLNTRSPAIVPLETPKTYQDYLLEFMQRRQLAQPYNTNAPITAPQAPTGIMPANPIAPLAQIGLNQALSEGGANLASGGAAYAGQQAAWNAGADAATAGQSGVGGIYSGASTGNAAGFIPYAGAAAGAYGLYDLGTRWGSGDRSLKGTGMGAVQGAASGAAIGSVVPGVGTTIGAVLGGLYGGASQYIKVGKHKDQKMRDLNRAFAKEKGVYDDKYNYTRLDGVTKNMGLDGSKGAYNIDWNDPNLKSSGGDEIIARLDPLGEFISGGNSKRRSDQVGEFYNAIKDAKDPYAEIRALYDKFGVNANTFKNFQSSDGNRADVYRSSVNKVFDTKKGVTYVTNQDEARKIKDEILKTPETKKGK